MSIYVRSSYYAEEKRAVENLKAKRRPGRGDLTHTIIGYENRSYEETYVKLYQKQEEIDVYVWMQGTN